MPDQLTDYHLFRPNEKGNDFSDLVRWLHADTPSRSPNGVSSGVHLGATPTFPTEPLAVSRNTFVNCDAAFIEFERMLTVGAANRILLVHGYGNQGKSTLLSALYLHIRALLGTSSAARIEFKLAGSTPDNHFRSISRALKVSLPMVGNTDDCIHSLLDFCSSKPTILFFDAYEHTEEQHRYWINLVLERALDDSLLRCVIAGREIPCSRGQPWARLAQIVECDALKDKDAIIAHVRSKGYRGEVRLIEGFIAGFLRLREREVGSGNHEHNISSQALLEELHNYCGEENAV